MFLIDFPIELIDPTKAPVLPVRTALFYVRSEAPKISAIADGVWVRVTEVRTSGAGKIYAACVPCEEPPGVATGEMSVTKIKLFQAILSDMSTTLWASTGNWAKSRPEGLEIFIQKSIV